MIAVSSAATYGADGDAYFKCSHFAAASASLLHARQLATGIDDFRLFDARDVGRQGRRPFSRLIYNSLLSIMFRVIHFLYYNDASIR